MISWSAIQARTSQGDHGLDLLRRIRGGESLDQISSQHRSLTTAQLRLARRLQQTETELNDLYRKIQNGESMKWSLERELQKTFQPTGPGSETSSDTIV